MSLKAVVKFINNRPQIEEGIGRFITRAVEKSTKVMERNVKYFTPVKHGTLRRSITSRMLDWQSGEVFTNPVGDKDHKEVTYGVYVEYGTRFMAPRAMFRKGVGASEAAIEQIFKREAKSFKDNSLGK